MNDELTSAIARSWTLPLWPTLGFVILGMLYLRGWRQARITRPQELPAWRAACFAGGLLVLWLALASPIDALGQFLLVAHMTQHLALMSIAPPLMVLGAPTVPLLRGLPRRWVRNDIAPWMNSPVFRKVREVVMHPMFAWISMNVAFIGWHVPAAYELALRSNGWHDVEHGCFFFTSLLFWWFVLLPWPSHSKWSRWLVLPYLMTADLVNTGLSAFLTFCGRVVYPTYAAVPRIFNLSPLNDQIAAGAEMWVLGSIAFWIPLMATTLQLLSRRKLRRRFQLPGADQRVMPQPFDLLRVPVLGAMLRARYGRIALQSASLGAIALVIVDGLRGSPLSSMNLAGTIAWNIIRPVSLVLILLAGNLFCMACPFTLPRELARSLGAGRLNWPSWLRRKWMAAALMVVFFWAYEQFSLWNAPRATALLLLGYIGAALLVNSIFRGGNFCKYVCPIGQFNFMASLFSPLELSVRRQSTCAGCTTHDCIRGNEAQRGCELNLYLPQKVGNLDCTLCMDCVKACPHDNIQITVQPPVRELVRDPLRSSMGRLSMRTDIALLALAVCFSSLVNAAYMISPVADPLGLLEQHHPWVDTTVASLLFTGLLSGLLILAWFLMARLIHVFTSGTSPRSVFCRFSLALLPLGLAMWVAHLGFHLSTALPSAIPVMERATMDFSLPLHWRGMSLMASLPGMAAVCRPIDLMLIPGAKGISLLSLQVLALDLGLLLSLYAGWKVSGPIASSIGRRAAMIGVWIAIVTALYALCLWIFAQPMQMRGMGMA